MLVCPHCQFENPDTHRYCQGCGTSLVEKDCPACGALVLLNAEYCLQCGTVTGTIWKAILSPSPEAGAVVSESATSARSIALPSGKFLDEQQRYQFLEPLPQQILWTAEAETRVLDHLPLQAPVIAALSIPGLPEIPIPPIAKVYLTLQNRFPLLALPRLHDAWQQDQLNILLLEDRSHLPCLKNLLQSESVLPLQILHWLHEMTEFWQILEPYGCCSSLLQPHNLHVDEDSLLSLQRLYRDGSRIPPLSALGRFWQKLCQQSQQTQHAEIARLCAELDAGTIDTLTQLRSRIESIAAGIQMDEPLISLVQPSTAMPVSTSTSLEAALLSRSSPADEPTEPTDPDITLDLSQPEAAIGRSAASPSLKLSMPSVAADPMADPTADPTVDPTADSLIDPTADSLIDPTASRPGERSGAQFNDRADRSGDRSSGLVEVDVTGDDTAIDDDDNETDDSPTVVLGMRLLSLEDAGQTDIGRQRNHNEDCFSIHTEVKKIDSPQGRTLHAKGLYILCDGMGGHASGEVASATAVETLQRYFAEYWQDRLPNEDRIRAAVQEANRVIFELNQQNASAGSGRMGTTLVVLLIHDTEAAIAHVGDSRLYRLSRRRGLQQLTTDHEVGQREIQRGVEPAIAYARPDAYQLTQALGPRDASFIHPDIKFFELNEDSILLLCSDGLSDNELLETHWQSHLEPLLDEQNSLEGGVDQLIELANQYNGHDNITALAVRLKVRPNLDQMSR
ncbi:MAG: serine/threonine phosphatase [Elainella sp. Prado103]|nr:serine/threonine phosphatase [Elainella sp. Prado103]